MPSRDYPDIRKARGTRSKDMVLLSARVDNSLWEYVRTLAFETRKSKQDIIAEALMLHRSINQGENQE
ncbi:MULTISPECIES: hypothetical protein [Citrobacter]|uniref:Ribbon-helix-helix protein, CopG family n=3 Tax=Enterobacteriaceae TaxID=543 RepID=A0A6I5ADU8_9ENTR|nr:MULTISPECIES: hypothetical protein [Citrobacter]MBS6075298.1 hypothetical protein [Citrobacter freundii]TKT96332.1 hypothetical protein FDW89_20405 [Citrobacter sp. wls830]GAS73903.1 hypothetical protein NGUA40_03526 [Salmonella enterica]AWS93868.1 hypothetical protein AN232_00640 [Citrobacter sp. CRE-46]AYL68959.1 hypothetical protein CUC50_24415 [Citrobacter werkmanii]